MAGSHHRRIVPALLSIVVALSIFSCRKDDNAPSGPALTQRTITIGALVSINGPGSSLGKNSLGALQAAEEDVNAYLDSVNAGVSFSIIARDTKMDSATALTYLDWLSSAGAQIVIGPQSSTEISAVRQFAGSNDILVVSQAGGASSLSLPGDNVFRFCPDDNAEARAICALLRTDSIKAIVPVSRNDLGSISLYQRTQAAYNGVTASAIVYPASTVSAADLSPAVAALHAAVASLQSQYGTSSVGVLLSGCDEASLLFRAAASDTLLLSVKWYSSSGVSESPALVSDTAAGRIAAGVSLTGAMPALDNAAAPLRTPLIARIQAQSGMIPDERALAAYDAFWVAALASMTVSSSGDFQSLRSAFIATANRHFGATGWTSLNVNGDRTSIDFDFWKLETSGRNIVWTKSAFYDGKADRIIR